MIKHKKPKFSCIYLNKETLRKYVKGVYRLKSQKFVPALQTPPVSHAQSETQTGGCALQGGPTGISGMII